MLRLSLLLLGLLVAVAVCAPPPDIINADAPPQPEGNGESLKTDESAWGGWGGGGWGGRWGGGWGGGWGGRGWGGGWGGGGWGGRWGGGWGGRWGGGWGHWG